MTFSTAFIAAGREYATFERQVPAPCFRRVFWVDKIGTAVLTLCGLGFYRLYVNGHHLTRGLLSPYISNPDHILYYDSYDIAPYLQQGQNVIALLLGNGMQNSIGGRIWQFDDARFRAVPKLALACEMTDESGNPMSFEADERFVTHPSPILFDDLRAGEFYDAVLEQSLAGWTDVGYDDSTWTAAIRTETPRGECRLCAVPPILPQKELPPLSVTANAVAIQPPSRPDRLPVIPLPEEEKHGYLYDFGINTAGLVRLRIKGRRGQKVSLQFGECLNGQGELYLNSANFLPERYAHRVEYICKGDGEETYTPSFTYFGFRYCLVSGIDEAQATSELLTCIVMHTQMEQRGTFSCSDPVANRLWEATLVSDLANFYHFPTDCPHREKNGWTGDAVLSAEQMMMALSPEINFREWLHSIRHAMREDGALPGVVPTGAWGFNLTGTAWDAVIVELPYMTWLYRGDTEILKENAAAILRYLHYLTTRMDRRGLVRIRLGDWCPVARDVARSKASLEATDAMICMDICRKAETVFRVLGMQPQADFAHTLRKSLRASVRRYLLDESGIALCDHTQTSQAMAIYYGVFEPSEQSAAFDKLLGYIDAQGGSFDCGVLGLRVIFHVLSRFGRTDLAYRMMTKDEFPSYGYWLKEGATSLWETFRPTFDKTAEGSFNHHFMGDIISWFMKNLVGIQMNPYEEDANEVRLAPKFIDALDHAEGSHCAVGGKIEVEWHRKGEDILYTATLPVGMRGELRLEDTHQTELGYAFERLTADGKPHTYRIFKAEKINAGDDRFQKN